MNSTPVLVYDGECGFCERSVRRVLARDHRGELRFAPRRGVYGQALMTRHPGLIDVDSLLWVEPEVDGREVIFTRFDAVLRTARHLGVVSRLLDLLRIVPGRVRYAVFLLLARHRHRL
jgi:predicted DCC family thiol-disulfide oxidoreductase YuxK